MSTEPRLCAHPICTAAAYQYTSRKTGKLVRYTLCNPHRLAAEKARDLAAWSYRKHKSNAKCRRKIFTISLEYFRAFAAKYDLLLGAGRTATSLHVDCINEALGYVEGNLQPLTNAENVRKENERRKRKIYDYELVRRRALGAYSCAAEAEQDEGLSEFRFVDDSPVATPNAADDDPPF